MKKILAVLMAVLVLASLFAGCASEKPAATTAPETTAPAGSTPAETTAPAETTEAPEEIVTLKMVAVGGGMPANYDAWESHINAYLGEKIGVNVEMEIISWGDWDQRRNMMVSTNEPYDIMFTNDHTYYNDVSMGAFTDISELVKTAAPDLYDFIPANYWDACRINGKVFAVPTYKDSSQTQYFVYDKAVVEEAYPEYADVHDLEGAAEVAAAIHDKLGTPSFIFSQGGNNSIYTNYYDNLASGLPVIGVSYDDDPNAPKVVITTEDERVQRNLELLQEMYHSGCINSDAAILSEPPKYMPMYIAQGWPLAAKTTWGPSMGVEAVAIQWEDTLLSNTTVQGSLNCISAACAHPEKALQLLELINLDPIVRDAFYYGLEGDNFDYVEVDGEKRVHKNNTDWTMAGYTQGTFFTVTTLDTDEFNQWDEVKALNEQAKPSPVLGFCLDTNPINEQLAACTAVWSEYKSTINTGTDISQVDAMIEAMRDCGLDEIVAEAQAQIDAWVAAK